MAIVTLTSDFGTSDGYVGAMKGVILTRAASAVIVDIAHDVSPCAIAAGAYCLAQAAPYFPPGTIHVAVVDPGVGTERRAVIADDGRCLFIAPDNGLLALAVPEPRAVFAIESPAFVRDQVSATFHGRDIFAAAAGTLARGGSPRDAGPQVALSPLPVTGGQTPHDGNHTAAWLYRVIYVDRFGNLITDCPGTDVAAHARITAGTCTIAGLSRTFGDVAVGAPVAYIGSAGTVEIAIRQDSAARVFGLGPGDPVHITE
ncbi:MAG: SAM-dependent chlorinase/fluorinase [Proteobacteria bacterium]|nr:SAM-dependent chlorinase/fluorinase [Pseudomonadota bacterium]